MLARISAVWDGGELFSSKWANIIASACIQFFRKYDAAPGPRIQGIYDKWAARLPEDTVELVGRFLGELSDDFRAMRKAVNSDYIIDLAANHLNRVKIKALRADLEVDLETDKVESALTRLNAFRPVALGSQQRLEVFHDEEFIRQAIDESFDVLVEYPGALGSFFGEHLCRGGFVSFMAPEKTGKTMWLLDVALRGAQQGRRVAMFEAGDMTDKQLTRRICQRIAKRPIRAREVKVPVSLEWNDDAGRFDVEHKVIKYEAGLSATQAVEAMTKAQAVFGDRLRLSVHPNSTLSVAGMLAILEAWRLEDGWTPDIVVIDYADILEPPPGVKEGRDRINETWKAMRSMSQRLHCLVVTASQSDAASYEQSLITRSNFTDDKRKLSHVTAMIGINVNPLEKHRRLSRLNYVVLREGDYEESKQVTIAHCLDLCMPVVLSGYGAGVANSMGTSRDPKKARFKR